MPPRPAATLALGVLSVLGVGPGPVTAAATSPPAPTAPPPAAVGSWAPPVPVQVARPFDPPPGRFAAGHRGVDLAGVPGMPVRAAGDGVVVFAGMVAGRPVVSIQHAAGLRTTYEPVEPGVGGGQPVRLGTVIGTLQPGHPGCPVAACLHWGARRDDAYLDPLRLLRPPRVRLLPFAGPAP